jgi:hypothetical protein
MLLAASHVPSTLAAAFAVCGSIFRRGRSWRYGFRIAGEHQVEWKPYLRRAVEKNAPLKEFRRTPHTSRCSMFFPWMSGATCQAKQAKSCRRLNAGA